MRLNPNLLRDTPQVQQLFTTDDHPGYMTQVMCMVDGTPARIDIIVNTKNREWSSFDLSIFDVSTLSWNTLNTLTYDEVTGIMGPVGILPDAEETRGHIQTVASALHAVATAILTAARQDEAARAASLAVYIDAERIEKRRERQAALRAERDRSAASEAAIAAPGWDAGDAKQSDFVLAGAPAADNETTTVLLDIPTTSEAAK